MEWMPSCRKENRVKVLLGYLADFFQSAAIKVHNDALVLHHVRDNLRRIEKHSTMSKYLAAGADIIKVAGFEKAPPLAARVQNRRQSIPAIVDYSTKLASLAMVQVTMRPVAVM
ncbi:hypothetical protein L916_08469 [Phytophthora nicotianae]|uniref:Uncharacterized protein n=1 Tax=Phytophthora nicotianae TaxID=4792 RepID=W2J1K7_PHYNI|nr:hypothetical protein L916_08469 [Phytophthora nicotianae]